MLLAPKLAAMALILVAAGSHAARPISIVFHTHAETADGKPYSQYTVKCNNGRSVPLTAWDGQRKWCIGGSAEGGCEKQQISAAKAACMDARAPA
ncbi:MAG: hypothetical protein KA135_09335 [Halioglobus sp.]|nr:hypothetical protein [Halioglobus sp.]